MAEPLSTFDTHAQSAWLPTEAELKLRRKRRVLWNAIAVGLFGSMTLWELFQHFYIGKHDFRWSSLGMLPLFIVGLRDAMRDKRRFDG